MASGDSKFDDLSEADIDSLIDDAVPKNNKKATAWGISGLNYRIPWDFFLFTRSRLRRMATRSY